MRAVLVSPALADPAERGRLHALAASGVAVAAAVPERWRPPGQREARTVSWGEDHGIRIVPVKVGGGAMADLRWSRRGLLRLFRDFRPDIIQVEGEPSSPVAAATVAAAGRLRLPVVVVASEGVRRTPSLLQGMRRQRVLARAAGLAAINRRALELVAEGRQVPSAILPLRGIEAPLVTRRSPTEPFQLGFVGRLLPERGLDTLFQSLVLLRGDWMLTVVGAGPAQPALEALAERLGISSRIVWRGGLPSEQVTALWPSLHALAIPSRSTPQWVEPDGRLALEAMAHGVPVVASSCGALPDAVGEAGLLVEEDNADALTLALRVLQTDPARREALAAAGRQRVLAHFVNAALARRYLEFWTRVLGAGDRVAPRETAA